MAGLFGGGGSSPAPLPEPKVTRMPADTDASIINAGKRTRESFLRRRGRLSTIMTEGTSGAGSNMVGSSGKSLGR